MKRGLVVALATVLVGCFGTTAQAQDEEGGGGRGRRPPVPTQITTVTVRPEQPKTVKVEVPVTQVATAPGVRADTPVFRGEGMFQQKCGVCHLGRWRKAGELKPVLSLEGVLKKDTSADREVTVREQIQRGSVNMPGLADTFTPAELNDLIAYLKTL